jgi:tripartite-type tricarboxylate transporter receptor subunit TctC
MAGIAISPVAGVISSLRFCLSILGVACAAFLAPASQTSTIADENFVEAFYRGKQITLYIGLGPGGAYDVDARLVAKHMSKYIPGNPVIVPKQMTGAGSMVAVSFAANVAPRDGTVLLAPHQSVPLQQALGDPGVKADMSQFFWLGTPTQFNNVLITWHTSGIASIDDAKKQEVMLGSTGRASTSSQYSIALNRIAGTKFKIVLGYRGGAEIDLAMERGEVAGRGSASWDAMKMRAGWLEDKMINVLVQIGPKRAKDLPNAPLLTDFASDDRNRAALRLLSSPIALGDPLLTTPGVPQERVDALRKAFDLTMKDPDLLRDAGLAKREINPLSGAEQQRIVNELIHAPKEVIEHLTTILGEYAK